VVLRQRLAMSYRGLIDVVSLMTPLLRRLRLATVLHFTTLHKFSLRLEPHVLDGLLATLACPLFVQRCASAPFRTGCGHNPFPCQFASRPQSELHRPDAL